MHAVKPDIGSESRLLPAPPALDAPVKASPSEYRHDVWYEKNYGAAIDPIVNFFLKICIFVLTELTNVTDGQTDTA